MGVWWGGTGAEPSRPPLVTPQPPRRLCHLPQCPADICGPPPPTSGSQAGHARSLRPILSRGNFTNWSLKKGKTTCPGHVPSDVRAGIETQVCQTPKRYGLGHHVSDDTGAAGGRPTGVLSDALHTRSTKADTKREEHAPGLVFSPPAARGLARPEGACALIRDATQPGSPNSAALPKRHL